MGKLLLYILGIAWIVVGALLVFAPEILRRKLLKRLKSTPLKQMGLIPLVLGILLILSAPQSRYSFIVVLMGLLGLAKGIFCIVATEKAEKMRDWWTEKATKSIYRIWGIVAIVLGSIVLMGI